jgi:hypothetical protein
MIVRIVRDDGDIIGVFDESADMSKFGDYKIDTYTVNGVTDGLPNWEVFVSKSEPTYKVSRWFGNMTEPIEQTWATYHYVSAKDEKEALRKVLES